MHDAFMPIGIRTTLTDSQVFQVTSHIVGLVVLCAEIPIHLLSKHQTYSLLTCTRIPCGGSHCENGRVNTHPVGCNRLLSAVNDLLKILKVDTSEVL